MNEQSEQAELESKMNELLILTPEQHQHAKNQAMDILKKSTQGKPVRADYNSINESEFGEWFTPVAGLFILFVFASAGIFSFLRVYESGYVYFLGKFAEQNGVVTAIDLTKFTGGINNPEQAALAGVLGFVLAEFMIIVSVVASHTIAKGKRGLQVALVIPVLIGGLIALFGNIVIEQPHDIFSWGVTIAPPVVAIIFSHILSTLFLYSLVARTKNGADFKQALFAWTLAHNKPESHPDFQKQFIAYLKIEIVNANLLGSGSKHRKSILDSLTYTDWRSVVKRELMQTSDDFSDVELSNNMMIGASGGQRLTSGQVLISAPPKAEKYGIHGNGGISADGNGGNSGNIGGSNGGISAHGIGGIGGIHGNYGIGGSNSNSGNVGSGKMSSQKRAVVAFFQSNPNRLNETCVSLEAVIGVSKTTINVVQNAIRNGEITI